MDSKKSSFEAYFQKMQRHFEQNSKIKEVQAHSSKVHSVAWSCDGRRLASGSFDRTVSIYTLDKYGFNKESNYRGHTESVDQLCWHPSNPDMLVTASGDKTIRIWDTRAGKCVNVVNTKGENINICWSPDGNTIAVGNKLMKHFTLLLYQEAAKLKPDNVGLFLHLSKEDLITFVDAKTYKPKCDEQFRFEVNEISWNNDNNLFFLTNGQGFINILSYPELKPLQTLHAHPANCICIKFDPTGKYFATGSADALISLWDLDELVCVRTFSRLDWPVRTLSFSHDGQMIASGSEDLLIDIAMVETGEKICDVPCTAPTFTLAWHPRKHILAFACDDKEKHDRDAGTVKIFGLPG